ncbi:MAG: putative amidohydrolase [Frankiales bacterium]|nr:putative amidohydrolase [Frankiales bacterium]
MERILMVSADGHAGAPPEHYRDYLDKRFHADLEQLIEDNKGWEDLAISQRRFGKETLDLIDRGGAIADGGEFGAYDLDVRLRELDREGCAAEILIPGHQISMMPFFGIHNRPASRELRQAGVKAYNRHLAEGMQQADGRLFAIADPGPVDDVEAAITELRWCAANGFVGVAPPGQIYDVDLPPLTSSVYEPYWAACEELGLVLNIHAGWGFGQFGGTDRMKQSMGSTSTPEEMLERQMTADIRIDEFPRDSPVRLGLTRPRRALWQLMMAGVFDRYPGLKLVFTEVRADWIPATLDVMDVHFAQDPGLLRKSPREYWAEHCYAAPSSPRPYELALRDQIGIDRMMFGMDFPHPEGTWPNTREWLRTTMVGLSESEARKFLGENAVECYGLDAGRLRAVADRIGLSLDEVLVDDPQTDPRLVRQFHARSGFTRPQEKVDPAFYVEMIDEDAATLAPR